MASKIKVDTLETANGSGTIALSNQLSGMTTASLPALGSAQMPSGSVLQVISTTMTDTLVYASQNTYADIAGLTATITPTSTSSKIMVTCNVVMINTGSNIYVALKRGSDFVGTGPASGNRSQVSSGNAHDTSVGTNGLLALNFEYLDSPSTTSATTYKVQSITDTGTVTYVNRTPNDTNAVYGVRSQSTITLMEIQG